MASTTQQGGTDPRETKEVRKEVEKRKKKTFQDIQKGYGVHCGQEGIDPCKVTEL
jgi:hypothetical protein